MAIQIAAGQASLKIDTSLARPDSTYTGNGVFIIGHLTTGWSGTDFVGDAVTCTGTVPVSGPATDVDRLELGFVQIARAKSFVAFYAGRTANEGSIGLDYFQPPALNAKFILDGTKGARDPWYRNPTFAQGLPGTRRAETGDHPGMVVRLSLENRNKSNVRNFLFHCIMDREFWTILTALEAGKKPQYIAHFKWQVRYEFKIRWKDTSAQPPVNLSTVRLIRGQTAGAPDEPELKPILDNPIGERANAVGKRAEATAVTGQPPNRSDNTFRFLSTPDDFWV